MPVINMFASPFIRFNHRSIHNRFRVLIVLTAIVAILLAACVNSKTPTLGIPTNPSSGTESSGHDPASSQASGTPVTPYPINQETQVTSYPLPQGTPPTPYLPPQATPTILQTTPASPGIPTSLSPSATLPITSITPGPSSTPLVSPSPLPSPTIPLPSPTLVPVMEIPEPIMGVESHSMKPAILNAFQSAGIGWTRRNALLWSDIEPVEGQRNWSAAASLESDLANSSKQGIQTVLIVRSTPIWAQRVAGHTCGPVRVDKFPAFASFMKELVKRYSAAPYNVKYWEIGNEPDVDPSLVDPNSLFGCWGDKNDPYYGGEYYANMLKVVYPAIKEGDPEAKVLNGGLLLDCDPSNPPEGKDCKSSLFLKGMLEAGGADYFDILSFHGYAYYTASWKNIETYGNWRSRGGYIIGKVSYLREVMNQYSINKPIFLTEGSLICPEGDSVHCKPPSDQFFETQASYVVLLFIRNWAAGIVGTFWYQYEGPGWRYSGMVDQSQQPKPDYKALTFLLEELKGASFTKETLYYDGAVRIFEFSLPQKRVWVLWSTDDAAHAVVPPGDAINILDEFGNKLTPIDGAIDLTAPVYIELQPG